MFVTLEQRVATRDAWQSWRGMVRALGERAPGPACRTCALPPAPDRIARTPYEVFHRFGIERRRADVLRRLAIVARRLEETRQMPLEDAYRRFMAITGVGPWTAARIGLIALGDPDAVPSATCTCRTWSAWPWPASGAARTSACSSCSSRSAATAGASSACSLAGPRRSLQSRLR